MGHLFIYLPVCFVVLPYFLRSFFSSVCLPIDMLQVLESLPFKFFHSFFVLLPRNNFNCPIFQACCFHQCLLPLLCLFVYLTDSCCTILIGLNSPCSPGYFKLRIFLPQKLVLRTYSPMPRFPTQDQCQAGIYSSEHLLPLFLFLFFSLDIRILFLGSPPDFFCLFIHALLCFFEHV